MAKKKRSLSFKIVKGIFYYGLYKPIELTVKGTYKGTNYLITKSKQRSLQRSIIKEQPTTPAIYHPFADVKNLAGSYAAFEQHFLSSPSTIGIILGARGTGKSAIGMKLLENTHAKTKRTVCAMGFRTETLPSWIQPIDQLDQIPNHSLILIDEAGISFSARSGMTTANKLLSSLLLIARHKDLSVLFISQNSSNIDINAIRQADFLILKPSSLLQKDFERTTIKDIYQEAETHFQAFKDHPGLAYIYSDRFKGFITNPLPTFWSQKTSKAYSQK